MPEGILGHALTLPGGADGLLEGVRDLAVTELGGRTLLLSVTAAGGGGLAVHEIGTDGSLARLAVAGLPGPALAGVPVTLTLVGTASGPLVLVTGDGAGIRAFRLQDSGNLAPLAAIDDLAALPRDLVALAPVTTPQGTFVYGLRAEAPAPLAWRLDARDRLAETATGLSPDAPDPLGRLTAVTGPGGQAYLAAAGSGDAGVVLYRVAETGALTETARLGPAEGPGIGAASDIESVSHGGRSFVLVAGQASGTISVLEVTAAGGLRVADHVIDTLGSRFGATTTLDTLVSGGMVHVAAGGGDRGTALFRLEADGRLLHLASVADDGGTALDGLAAAALCDPGGTPRLVTAALREPGLSLFDIDTGALRVLRDGGGSERLTGQAGADLFVLGADGLPDRIDGFDPGEDRIDLSGWVFFRGAAQLDYTRLADGAVIAFGDERLEIHTRAGTPLERATLDALELAPVHRFLPGWVEALGGVGPDIPEPPPPAPAPGRAIAGTLQDDILTGDVGDDTMRGHAGNDRMSGEGGNDMIWGGDGADLVNGNAGNDALEGEAGDDLMAGGIGWDAMRGGDGADLLRGQDGRDTLDGGAGDDRLFGNNGFDMLTGGEGADEAQGGLGSDTLDGGAGDDRLEGNSGTDLLRGQDGHDHLLGNAGADRLEGGAGDDRLEGGINHDRLLGGAGRDTLSGDNGSDTLEGGAGNDLLKGNAGADRLDGGAGDDDLHGGIGADVFVFSGGHDRVLDFGEVDGLLLASGLWGGAATEAALRARVEVTAAGLVLDFGAGGSLTLLGESDPAVLSGTVEWF